MRCKATSRLCTCPSLRTLINDGGFHHVYVTVPEIAGCDKIKNLVDLVAKKGH